MKTAISNSNYCICNTIAKIMWTILDLFPGIVLDIMIVSEDKALIISLENISIIIKLVFILPWRGSDSLTKGCRMLAKDRVSSSQLDVGSVTSPPTHILKMSMVASYMTWQLTWRCDCKTEENISTITRSDFRCSSA